MTKRPPYPNMENVTRPGHHMLPDLLGALSIDLQDVPVGSLIISV